LQGNNELLVFDAFTGAQLYSADTGLAPYGVAIDNSRGLVFTKNLTDRTVSIVDASDVLVTGSGRLSVIDHVSTVTQETLSAQVLRGKQVFYNAADERMSADGYLSCASCHIEGTQDGRVWDFTDRGEGLRNTASLLGVGNISNGRLHWSGNFDEVQDFEQDIRQAFGGRGFLTDRAFETTRSTLGLPKAGRSVDLDALAAYVNSLSTYERSPYKRANGYYSAKGRQGARHFVRLNCLSCHALPYLTDSQHFSNVLHDVGTIADGSGARLGQWLAGFDTPTLIGLSQTAPYLHDGSANRLESVFEIGAHNVRDQLTDTEFVELMQFLREIDAPLGR